MATWPHVSLFCALCGARRIILLLLLSSNFLAA
jgi:hypothetical protein